MSTSRKITLSQSTVGRSQATYTPEEGASIQCVVTNSPTYSVQWSNDGGNNWVDHDTISSATANASGSFNVPVEIVAVNVSSVGSPAGTVSVYIKG